MVLAGTFLAMKKKHTTGLQLDVELREAVRRYQEQQVDVIQTTDRARDLILTDDQARLAIFNAFEREILSPRLFPEVVANYFKPEASWTDCTPRSRWGLVGAFTRAIRPMPPETKLRTTTSLAYLLREGVN